MAFRICYITDRRALEPAPLIPRIGEAVRAGVDLIQIREKDLATRDLVELTAAALDAARGTSTRVVVNDRLDVAMALSAAGVHLATASLPARAARRIAPADFLIGVSCHSLQEALEAESAHADYILLGPIFPTPSKLRYGPPLGVEKLREVCARVRIPVLALGGMKLERAKPCVEAGAAGIAGISLFQNAPSLEELLPRLGACFPK
jgi:thiamine-phosphate pyrophosphorylase